MGRKCGSGCNLRRGARCLELSRQAAPNQRAEFCTAAASNQFSGGLPTGSLCFVFTDCLSSHGSEPMHRLAGRSDAMSLRSGDCMHSQSEAGLARCSILSYRCASVPYITSGVASGTCMESRSCRLKRPFQRGGFALHRDILQPARGCARAWAAYHPVHPSQLRASLDVSFPSG